MVRSYRFANKAIAERGSTIVNPDWLRSKLTKNGKKRGRPRKGIPRLLLEDPGSQARAREARAKAVKRGSGKPRSSSSDTSKIVDAIVGKNRKGYVAQLQQERQAAGRGLVEKATIKRSLTRTRLLLAKSEGIERME